MRDYVTFVLNGELERVLAVSPTTTLLQWLRRERHLTGTKEGCAEGDCGACTVVVGRRNEAGLVHYSAINSCIVFLPMLDGASVETVEAVAASDGSLHPVQQALVDAHGSQCGFCTPGFVMSLLALYRNSKTVPAMHEIDDALVGNLCRCTGYGPIVLAAQLMFQLPRARGDVARLEQQAKVLADIRHEETILLEGAGQRMFVPVTEKEFTQLLLANPDARIVAGATDIGLWVTKQGRSMPVSIHIGRVREFSCAVEVDGGVLLGSGLTHTEAAEVIANWSGPLAELWRRFAGVQIRNIGTIGGNIANGSPIGDLAPAFIALGARLHLRCGDVRRSIPIEDFFIAYGRQDLQIGEYIAGIELPGDVAGNDLRVHKVSKRFDDDISAVCGAFNIHVVGDVVAAARIAFGGMAATPKRARFVEAALIGNPWTRATIEAAMMAFTQDFEPISDVRASAGYRMQVAQNLLLRIFLERTEPTIAMRLIGAATLVGG
jgi:xanthine dehydrogenase small subunit